MSDFRLAAQEKSRIPKTFRDRAAVPLSEAKTVGRKFNLIGQKSGVMYGVS
jgi:hypothetical protein